MKDKEYCQESIVRQIFSIPSGMFNYLMIDGILSATCRKCEERQNCSVSRGFNIYA